MSYPYAVTVITDPSHCCVECWISKGDFELEEDDHCSAPDGTTFDRYLHHTMCGVQSDIDYFREEGYWREFAVFDEVGDMIEHWNINWR